MSPSGPKILKLTGWNQQEGRADVKKTIISGLIGSNPIPHIVCQIAGNTLHDIPTIRPILCWSEWPKHSSTSVWKWVQRGYSAGFGEHTLDLLFQNLDVGVELNHTSFNRGRFGHYYDKYDQSRGVGKGSGWGSGLISARVMGRFESKCDHYRGQYQIWDNDGVFECHNDQFTAIN